jgi:two-component system response regulator RegX3
MNDLDEDRSGNVRRTSVLVVEDDEATCYALQRALEEAGFAVEIASDGEGGLAAARAGAHDVVVLDWLLPGLPGIEVCRLLRAESAVPIIMLTAKGEEVDRVVGLELGADDYVPKPFSLAELVSRVRALLRRQELEQHRDGQRIVVGGLVLDPVRHRIEVDGTQVHVTPTEFRLLALLASEPERVFERREIMRHLWESDFVGDLRNVNVHVRNLRRKIERTPEAPERLVSVPGIGYQLLPA